MKFFLYDTSQTLMPNIKATAISATVDQELGKYDALNATFAKTASNVEDFKKVDKVGVEVDGQLELFKITQPEISDNQITIAGVESASDDLAHQSYMLASSNDSLSLSQALQMVFSGTTWTYDLQAEDTTAGIDFSTGTKQEALEQVLDTWQVECYFTYSATTSKITNQICHIVNKRGIDTHKRLVKGVNVSSFTYSRDLSTIVTGAYATGATPDNQDADTSNTETSNTTNQDDTEKQPYTLADSTWDITQGDPMNHSLGDPTLVLEGATNQYGYVDSNGNRLPRMVTLSYSNDDPQQLIRHVYDYLLIHSQPSLTLTATVYKLQSASLGNRYIAIDREDGIVDASIRAIKIQRNLLNDELSVVTLGNYVIPTASERAKKQQKQTQKAEKTAKEAKEKAEKADKETKKAKEKADKANKDLDDYKDSETKRRAAKAKEHAANHEARVKADAARDAKIAQNSKDIDDIKKNGSGSGSTDISKIDGLITLEMETDSKSKIKTVNVNNKDNSQLILKNDGLYWKSPDQVKADKDKKQDEIDSENAKLTPALIDQEGYMRPPAVIMSDYKHVKAGFGGYSANTFGVDISGVEDSNKNSFNFATGADETAWSISSTIGKQQLAFNNTGLGLAGNLEINGYSETTTTDQSPQNNLFVGVNTDGEFQFKMKTDRATTTISSDGITIDGASLTQKRDSSDITEYPSYVSDGLSNFADTKLDNHAITFGEAKTLFLAMLQNVVSHGTGFDDTEFDSNLGNDAPEDERQAFNGYKHGDKRLVTYGDFYWDHTVDGNDGSIVAYLKGALSEQFNQAVKEAVHEITGK
ncbi:phage tail protein [Lactobacillus kitasatonis]|uniref:phage tail protein n=1 Tax=Lactobacillus kitasatonis TaxID=237446 RepID=UPI003F669A58